MTRPVYLLVAGIVFMPWSSLVWSDIYPSKGYVQNQTEEKCWYKQKTDETNKYFFGIDNIVGIMTFNDPQCMSDTLGVGLDINKMMINNVISKWYSHDDTEFQTHTDEMYFRSPMQKEGKCIQSKKYKGIGIAIDYLTTNGSITKVIHGQTIDGCFKLKDL